MHFLVQFVKIAVQSLYFSFFAEKSQKSKQLEISQSLLHLQSTWHHSTGSGPYTSAINSPVMVKGQGSQSIRATSQQTPLEFLSLISRIKAQKITEFSRTAWRTQTLTEFPETQSITKPFKSIQFTPNSTPQNHHNHQDWSNFTRKQEIHKITYKP